MRHEYYNEKIKIKMQEDRFRDKIIGQKKKKKLSL